MTSRLTSAMLVGALVRRVAGAGGNAAVLKKGDATAGALLIVCAERGQVRSVRERVLGTSGYAWESVGPESEAERAGWLERRRARDPDLWVVELDIPNAERFAAETIGDA